MAVLGVDVGSLSAKAVIVEHGKVVVSAIIGVKPTPVQSAREVTEAVLESANLRMVDIDYCVSTGYGRAIIPFANKSISEISCHGKGAHWSESSVRGIIDIGGQDCKAITVDESGDLVDFTMNDKCAAGTGRFLEIVARTLGVDITELGELGCEGEEPIPISNRCSVFAEYEILLLLAEGRDVGAIGAGANEAMAKRAFALTRKIKCNSAVTVTGGVAKNRGVKRNLERLLQSEVIDLPHDPQIMGALGAALFAQQNYQRGL